LASEALQQAKKFLYEENLDIEESKVTLKNEDEPHQEAEVIFQTEEGEKKVSGTQDDFISFCFGLDKVIRDGERKLAEIDTDDASRYYENMDLFIDSSDNPGKEAHKRLIKGESNLKKELNLRKALDATIEENFEQEDLISIAENFHDAKVLAVLNLQDLEEHKQKLKETQVKDVSRYETLLNEAGSIFQDEILTKPPLKAYETFRKTCNADIEFLLKRLGKEINRRGKEWEALFEKTGGKMDGETGMSRILDEYAMLYEIIQDVLRDYASMLRDNPDEVDLNNEKEVIRFLKRQGYNQLVGTIISQFRHGPNHQSIEIDNEEGLVRVYEERSYSSKVLEEYTYEKVNEKYRKFRDLSLALLFSYTIMEEVMVFRSLDSFDFKLAIIENYGGENE
jgi:hypothetical protein